jgi:hypothetical protein
VDNPTPSHSEKDTPGSVHNNENRTHGGRAETSVERSVRRTLIRTYIVGGLLTTVGIAVLLTAGFFVYHKIINVDRVKPDYTSLDKDSDTYWTDRILIDIETAKKSGKTDDIRLRYLRDFAFKTIGDAMNISDSEAYVRAQSVTGIAMVLAQHDVDIPLDNQLQKLGDTIFITSMRARAHISQALMYLRLQKSDAARKALRQYNRLLVENDIRLNLSINEESFFGAVTVLWILDDKAGLNELFQRQLNNASVAGMEQRMRTYRLIVGEQVRTVMILDALDTAKRIENPTELARAWSLILQYSARPPKNLPVEPTMLDLLDDPQTEPLKHPDVAEHAAKEIIKFLAENKDTSMQISLLQRIAGSRLMCDEELYGIFRRCVAESAVLDDRVKQQVLKLLDDPESPSIRQALNMPPRVNQTVHYDPADDDWTSTEEIVRVAPANIDSTPLRTRTDQQWVQAWLAVAQSYQSVRRFRDADRILKWAFDAASQFTDPDIRVPLLMRIGEQQIAVGSVADARETFASVAPSLDQKYRGEWTRLLIIARLFDDATKAISSIESPEIREYVCSLLLKEQIRINLLDNAEKTLTLIPQGKTATECRSRLNIAKNSASREDFNALGIAPPEGNDASREQYCVRLIQQGFLRLADKVADGINDPQKQDGIRTRVIQEYIHLYGAFSDSNDSSRTIRQELQQAIMSSAGLIHQPVIQTTVLTEFLMCLAEQLKTEEDRANGKRLWSLTMDLCRKIDRSGDKAVRFAQLIVAKNMLENPNFVRKALPLFTKESKSSAFEETKQLIDECLNLVNTLELKEQQGHALVHLGRAEAQVGLPQDAQKRIDRVLEIAGDTTDQKASISMFLSVVPTLKAVNSTEQIPWIYRVAMDRVAHEFISRSSNVDEFDWRVRDSEIERIVRSQMENGFVKDAVESASRLNEPVLRDRLLRTAAFIYLDRGDIDRAELEVRRLTVKEVRDNAVQTIQIIKRRSKP